MLRLLLLEDPKLVVPFLDRIDRICVLLAEQLVLVALNAHGRRLNVAVVCPLREFRVLNDNVALCVWVPLHMLVHRLVVLVDLIFVAQGRQHLLFNDGAHAGS